MKKILKTCRFVLLGMGLAGVAHANHKIWNGFYAGANAGFVFNDAQLKSQHAGFTSSSGTCNQQEDFSGFSPGIQFGYLHQFSNFLVSGIEASASFNTDQQQNFRCESEFNPDVYDAFLFRDSMQASVKGRLGFAQEWARNRFLPYLTAGVSFVNAGLRYENEGGDYDSHTAGQLGWLIGAGIEWAFMQHWSLRAEYNFVDYGEAIRLKIPAVYGLNDPDGSGSVNLSSSNIALALNYWFDPPG